MSVTRLNRVPSLILVANYHYFAPANEARWLDIKGVTPTAFERQLSEAARICTLFDLDALFSSATESTFDGVGCLVTFDDGMANIVEHALPILYRYRFPSIIFCCAMPYVEGKVLNVQKSHLLQGRWGWEGFRKRFIAALVDDPEGECRDSLPPGLGRMYRYDDDATGAFKRLLNVELPHRVADRILDRMFEYEFGPQGEAVKALYLSVDDIKRCADKGVGIGLHTYAHRMISRLSTDAQAVDLDASLALFRDRLGLDVRSISYPYGIIGSWNDDSKRLARERGLHYGFTLGRQVYCLDRHNDAMEIPRYDVNDVFSFDGTFKDELLR
jgi:peptidoglycan/xylan/chitin deacetylase (PgdA/CDA1 family)